MSRSTRHEPTRRNRAAVALLWLAAAGGAITALLVTAASAEGGTYRAVQCHPGYGAARGDFSFERNSEHYLPSSTCLDGRGLGIQHSARRSGGGRWGEWRLRAPAGASLRGVTARVRGVAAAGHVPELLVGMPGATPVAFGRATGSTHSVRWRGEGAESFGGRLRCARSGGCGEGRAAKLALRRVEVRLHDGMSPTVEIGGALAGDATVRGRQILETIATDSGSGVRRVFLEVNDRPLAGRRVECALRRRVATRLQPCPESAEPSFDVSTAGSDFRQGLNRVRVCALDFAVEAPRNDACTARRVRVDNACPVDEGSPEGRPDVRLAGVGPNGSVRHRRPARVVGRLADGDGEGIAGAEVCVATQVDLPGEPERVVATPTTGPGGGFEARLEPGPSREIRVAHWPDARRVAESHLRLPVRSRPRLRIRPHRTLRNGQRAHFAIRLHGPNPASKRVHVKVRTGGHWTKVTSKDTDARGRARGRYRFRSTSGAQTYRFRAFVPRQPGYPFETGWSATKRVRVRG